MQSLSLVAYNLINEACKGAHHFAWRGEQAAREHASERQTTQGALMTSFACRGHDVFRYYPNGDLARTVDHFTIFSLEKRDIQSQNYSKLVIYNCFACFL